MADQIRVLIVDDIPETRDHLAKLLGFETDFEVVGAAASGREAIEMAGQLRPDVVLMDINMPDMDGIAATERLAAEVPSTAVVMMSVQGEADYLRRSMLAGAREFLVKPFSIRRAHLVDPSGLHARAGEGHPERGAVGHGAVGRACDARRPRGRRAWQDRRRVRSEGRRGPDDAGRQPRRGRRDGAWASARASWTHRSSSATWASCSTSTRRTSPIADLIPELESGEPESLDTFLINHSAGIRVLLAPPSPEMAELITPLGAKRMLEALRMTHDLVVVDCMSSFNDTTLAILDLADTVLTMLSLEITSIKNIRLFLEVAEQLGYSQDKVRLVLNRADSSLGIRVADVEHSIGRRVDHTIVSDGRSVVYALNRGVPFFLSNREAQVSQDVLRLASAVVGTRTVETAEPARKPAPKKSLFAWR